jgi:hypothetical protein
MMGGQGGKPGEDIEARKSDFEQRQKQGNHGLKEFFL